MSEIPKQDNEGDLVDRQNKTQEAQAKNVLDLVNQSVSLAQEKSLPPLSETKGLKTEKKLTISELRADLGLPENASINDIANELYEAISTTISLDDPEKVKKDKRLDKIVEICDGFGIDVEELDIREKTETLFSLKKALLKKDKEGKKETKLDISDMGDTVERMPVPEKKPKQETPDYYKILDVGADTTIEHINRAYGLRSDEIENDFKDNIIDRAKYLKKMSQLVEAHDVLVNPKKRAEYDEQTAKKPEAGTPVEAGTEAPPEPVEPPVKKAKKTPLAKKWDTLKELRERYKNEPDEATKKSLSEQWKSLYKEFTEFYKEETGRELRDDIKEKATSKPGVRFMKVEQYREMLEKKAAQELKKEEPEIRKKVQEDRHSRFIKESFDKIPNPNKEKYKNEKGEIDIKEYEKELDDQRDRANKELERHGVELSKDVFYELMRRGYQAKDIKGKMLEKDEGRAVVIGLTGVVAVGSVVTMGLFGGIVGGGAAGLSTFGEKFLSKRLYGGVKIPSTEKPGETLSQEELELLVQKIERESQKSLEEEVEKAIHFRDEEKKQEIIKKIKKGKKRFNGIKNEATDNIVSQAVVDGKKSKETLPKVATLEEAYELLTENEKKTIDDSREAVKKFFEDHDTSKESLKILKGILEDKKESPLWEISNVKKRREKIVTLLSKEVNNKVKQLRKEERLSSQKDKREPVEKLNPSEGENRNIEFTSEELEALKNRGNADNPLEVSKPVSVPENKEDMEKVKSEFGVEFSKDAYNELEKFKYIPQKAKKIDNKIVIPYVDPSQDWLIDISEFESNMQHILKNIDQSK